MSQITLVRHPGIVITDEERATARKVLFGNIDGLGELGKKQWRRLINGLMRLEPGEMVEIITHKDRLDWYHRKHMALETAVFEAQEKFDSFDQFRNWLKVGSGFCDWIAGPKGAVIPVPRSLSYAKLEQGEMESVHEEMVKFLRSEHAGKTLWHHLSPTQRIDMIENLLEGFKE